MADQQLGDPAPPEVLDGFEAPEDVDEDAPRGNRRALWLSLAALFVVTLVAIPTAAHFLSKPAPRVHAPAHVAGLSLDNSSDAKSTADYLRSAVAAGMGLQHSIGAVYTDGAASAEADAHSVIFIGGTAKGSNTSLVTAIMGQMDDSTDGISGLSAQDAGAAGGLMKCGLTTSTQNSGTAGEMAVCAFAGGGEVGIALFPNRTVVAAATLMRQIHVAVK
jgi:hypothetical protein